MKTKPAQEYRRQIHELRLGKRKSVDHTLWNNLHYDITRAMRAAQKNAELTSDFQAVIRQRQNRQSINNVLSRQGREPLFELENR